MFYGSGYEIFVWGLCFLFKGLVDGLAGVFFCEWDYLGKDIVVILIGDFLFLWSNCYFF